MATARIVLDTRRAKENGLYPIKIRIAHVKDWKFFTTIYSLNEADFQKVLEGKYLNADHKKMRSKLDAEIDKAEKIIEDLQPFNFDAFTLRYTAKGNRSDLLFLLREKAERLRKEDKFGNANLYDQAANLLGRFNATTTKAPELPINVVVPAWLNKFEAWALKLKKTTQAGVEVQEYSKTTLGMYLIRVRAIFNEVIDRGELNRSLYPFHRVDNRNGYKIPKGANNKRPLSVTEIMQLYNYQTEHKGEQLAKDMFIFSYLSGGMNMIDIFRLKWSDIKSNQFTFIRKKTENKTGGTNKISINISEDLQTIIERQGSHKINNPYIFNIIPRKATEKEMLQSARVTIAAININLKKIAKTLNMDADISTYYARHSYANNLMNDAAPLAFISKQLGHTDLKTTQSYLDTFTTTKAAEYEQNLLDKKIG
ncbi:MAG: tyrosine-type recombinase/integrase [Bacteroidota bacterium]